MAQSHHPPAMSVQRFRSSPALARYIHHFGLRVADLKQHQIYNPLPARSDCFLEIYLDDRYRIVDTASGAIHYSPAVVLVGPHTQRKEDLLLSGTLRVFHIHFAPAGFRALFGVPAHHLANFADAADSVLGREVSDLAERLAAAHAAEEFCAIAEGFLLSRLRASPAPVNAPVAAIAHALQRSHGTMSIDSLARRYELSVRQVERLFHEHVGIPPKTFSRLARLSYALKLTRQAPAGDWAEIAIAAGFYDQSHLVREFRALTGETPPGFAALCGRAATLQPGRSLADDVAFVLSPARKPG